jgi:BMFP domain-containing protein YqiC
MSAMESDRDKIAQKLAVLEKRVEELEGKLTGENSYATRNARPAKQARETD